MHMKTEYLWLCIVSYPVSAGRNLTEFRSASLANRGKKICGIQD
jgi:hypothetical protein